MHKYLLSNVALPANMLNAKVNYDVITNLNQNWFLLFVSLYFLIIIHAILIYGILCPLT